MNSLINKITSIDTSIDKDVRDSNFEENLFVKNIIVNKDKGRFQPLSYIPTEKWVKQLGSRLEHNF